MEDGALGLKGIIPVTVSAALIVFRKYESYSVMYHACLLFGLPTLIATYVVLPSRSLSLWTYLLCYTTYLVTLSLSVVLYRLSPAHPLAEYPGPFWCRTSKLWHATIVGTGRQPMYLQALHDRHGDVVRIAPNALSFRDPSVIPQVFGGPGNAGIQKGPHFIGGFMSTKNYPMVGIPDTEEHLRHRRPWARGLNPAALKEYELMFARRVRQLADKLEEQHSEMILGDWFDRFLYDFMTDMAFGGGSKLLQEGDTTGIRKIVVDGCIFGTFLGQVPFLALWLGKIPAAVAPLNTFIKYGQECAKARMARGSATKDLFHYLNNEDLPNALAPPMGHLIHDGILAIIAGSDTTASALTSIFFCILTNPDKYIFLQEEVDRYYPPGDDALSTRHHRDMVYLNAVINETLRLFPPLMVSSSRQIPHNSSGVVVGSRPLPPGTAIFVPPYVLHRDSRNFSFPAAFWPERWLVVSGHLSLDTAATRLPRSASVDKLQDTFELVHNEAAFIPFSVGPMNCVGKGLAMQEMRTAVCALMQRFRFRLKEGWDLREYEKNYLDYFVSTRPDLPVTLELRN